VSAPEEHDLRERERIGVRDRQKRTAGAHRVEPALRAGMELEARWATVAHDFHALPEHILRVSRSERLHRGFLRRESSGKMNGGDTPTHAVGDLTLREDALDEPTAVPLDRCGNAWNVGCVDSEPDNGGHTFMILPRPDASFEWRETPFGPALVSTLLEPIAPHFFTTQQWTLGHLNGSAAEAWAEIPAAFGPALPLVRLRQVHGRTAVVAEQLDQDGIAAHAAADIIVSRSADRVIAVQAADCVPLLVADTRLGVVAAAHAGWRGLALGVPGATVRALMATYGSDPHDLVAAIGPSVGACCYEVGPDVREAFRAGGFPAASEDRWFRDAPVPSAGNPPMAGLPEKPRPGHAFFDGWTSAVDQLTDAGIPAGQIACARLCTASHPAVLCSYRRDGVRAGRMAGAIRASRRP